MDCLTKDLMNSLEAILTPNLTVDYDSFDIDPSNLVVFTLVFIQVCKCGQRLCQWNVVPISGVMLMGCHLKMALLVKHFWEWKCLFIPHVGWWPSDFQNRVMEDMWKKCQYLSKPKSEKRGTSGIVAWTSLKGCHHRWCQEFWGFKPIHCINLDLFSQSQGDRHSMAMRREFQVYIVPPQLDGKKLWVHHMLSIGGNLPRHFN